MQRTNTLPPLYKVVLLLVALCCGFLLSVTAQGAVDTVKYDNLHIAVTDPDGARQWYVEYLDGEERDGLVYFGDTYFRFIPTDEIRPSTGSVIDHIGLSFPDLAAVMARLEDSGATVLSPMRNIEGFFPMAYVEDPWGVKFELVQDPQWPDFHHIHLRVPDPTATLDWYQSKLGGVRESFKGRLDGLRFEGVWLLASPAGDDEVVSSADRAVRNLAWEVEDVVVASSQFQQMGVTLISDSRPFQNLRYAFFEDPDGVRVELLHYADQ
ncbi:MAG: VOC family protein [Gammaproteobacteria bacterium]|nr:VOC family protein [Pseudomonadales bacterium]MCP5349190.1 VOC family protein [Pseudomonadales bacterium]